MRRYLLTCGLLGIISLGSLVLGGLALFDISQGEPDLTNEWRAVKVAVLPLLGFHLMAIVGLFTAAGKLDQPQKEAGGHE